MFTHWKLILGCSLLFGLTLTAVAGQSSVINKFAAKQGISAENPVTQVGQVAGVTVNNMPVMKSKEQLQKQVDQIKDKITHLSPDDLKNTQTVQKLLNDLDSLKEEVSQSAQASDVKSHVCEEVKKRFCEN